MWFRFSDKNKVYTISKEKKMNRKIINKNEFNTGSKIYGKIKNEI